MLLPPAAKSGNIHKHYNFSGCIAEKRCSDVRAACDVITHKAASSPCFDEGQCDEQGNCLDFCRAKGTVGYTFISVLVGLIVLCLNTCHQILLNIGTVSQMILLLDLSSRINIQLH